MRARTLAVAVALLGVSPRARAQDDEPAPRPIFFHEPDEETAKEIAALVGNSFKDPANAGPARVFLVRRYGLVSAATLARVIEANVNEPEVWGALVTIASMRRAQGPATPLFPALPPMLRLLRDSPEPGRRALAALALGAFYGPEGLGTETDPPSAGTDGPRARAKRTLVEATAALGARLSDEAAQVRVAAALALGKIGGMDAWSLVSAHAREASDPARAASDPYTEARMAVLLALCLLPGGVEGRLETALVDPERRLRAIGALGIAVRAVQAHMEELVREPDAHLVALDRALQNERFRENLWDGAEAVFARGSIALLGATPKTWNELFEVAIAPSVGEETAVAAAQALLFCPEQDAVRKRIAEFAGRENVGNLLATKKGVLAAFLLMAGSDGTREGVAACASFLRSRAKTPRGAEEYDVRYHAAVGLVRALVEGRIPAEARAMAVEALHEGARVGLQGGGKPRSFQQVLEEVIGPTRQVLLGNPDARLPASDARRLEASFPEPDALFSREPAGTAVHRLNQAVRRLFGLDNLSRATGRDAQGGRAVSRDEVLMRYLEGWLGNEPYLSRRDLLQHRGRPATPSPLVDPERRFDR